MYMYFRSFLVTTGTVFSIHILDMEKFRAFSINSPIFSKLCTAYPIFCKI